MMQLSSDLWSLLLPPEWHAEQEDETIFIVDEDEVSIIELTALFPEQGLSLEKQLKALLTPAMVKTTVADFEAYYHSFIDDDMYWREWLCDCGDFILMLSHGCDVEHQGMDDGSVDEILSSLVLNPPQP